MVMPENEVTNGKRKRILTFLKKNDFTICIKQKTVIFALLLRENASES